jgi:hypothetical protein
MTCDFCGETHQSSEPCDGEKVHAVELYTRAHTEILSRADFRWLGEYESQIDLLRNQQRNVI